MADDINNPNAFPSAPGTDAELAAATAPMSAPAGAPPEAERAPAAATGPVNVINPEGQLVSIPGEQLQDALDQGFQPATQAHLDAYDKEQKYGTTGEQLKTAAEGAASAATFGLSAGVEEALGANPEDIQARREVNPGSHMAGQAAGLIGSAFIPGAGAANLLGKAGEGAAALVGLHAAESVAAKIGSTAIKGAVENALFQSGDEVSKMLSKDAGQSVETAMTDIGLSALLGGSIGGAVGAVNPLWKATLGAKTDGMLRAITNKLGGIEGESATAVETALDKAGIEAEPQVRAALLEDPFVQQASQILQDSATSSGLKHQEALKAFKGQLSDSVVNTMGKTPEELTGLEHLSENKTGEEIKGALADRLKAQYEPLASSYEKISNRFKTTEIPQNVQMDLSESLAKALDPGVSQESAEAKLVQRVLKEAPGLKNLEQLRNYTSGLSNETSGIAKQELWGVARRLRSALNDAQEKTLTEVVAKDAPELSEELAKTNAAYKDLKSTIGDLNDRLKVGAHAGPKTFLRALNDMDGEAVLRRLSPKGKADIIGELSNSFPEVAQKVKDFHLNQLLKTAAVRAGEGETLNTKALLKSINGLSPEMREFVLPPGAAEKLKAIDQLMESMPSKIGKSGTPQGLDGLTSWMPASAAGALTMLLGHNPAAATGVALITKVLGRDVPDAARLGLLKFLGSSSKVDAEGFKAMVDVLHSTIKGENLVGKATKSVFQAGKDVLPQAAMPSHSDVRKLDKRLKEVQADPSSLTDVGGKTAHYLPDHGTAMGQVASNAVNYLNSLRPNVDRRSPLDTQAKPSPVQQAEFDRALSIAQQPLIVVDKIKDGSITPKDIQAIKTLYPNLYSRISEKLTNEMVAAVDKETPIPYATRMGLSLFMGQPLDSTMSVQGIQAAQLSLNGPQQQNPAGNPPQGQKHSMTALNKLPGAYQTPGQAREQRQMKS